MLPLPAACEFVHLTQQCTPAPGLDIQNSQAAGLLAALSCSAMSAGLGSVPQSPLLSFVIVMERDCGAGKATGLLDAEALSMLGAALAQEPPLPPARFVALLHDFAGILHCERTPDCLLAYSL